ncbi:hypothetical protein BDV95DRAFT_502055, partial [Massariosphaeria phaeospora]
DHPIFDKPIVPVPALLGVPLVMHKVGTRSNNNGADLSCRIATCLNADPETSFAPPTWQFPGTCIVARRDRKPLSSEHLEAVWMYIDKLQDYHPEDEPEDAEDPMSREGFEGWFEDYKNDQAENGRDGWKDVGAIDFIRVITAPPGAW